MRCRPKQPAPIAFDPSPVMTTTDLCQLDNYDLSSFVHVAASFGNFGFAYAVTPNADHLLRLHDDRSFRALYADADFILLDSRFLARVLRLTRGVRLPVCPGSDLTEQLFKRVIKPADRIVVIGGASEQARQLAASFGLRHLAHHNPPMGFTRDPKALGDCLAFVEANSPFRFCFIAVGAPQQELVAHLLKLRGRARGLALCVGSAINFLTGLERRAPHWMQNLGLEWLFRLLQAPRRLGQRYLVRGPRVFALLRRTEFRLRQALPQGEVLVR
jgi:exopolysaccharide biosynthesis WecB/TagA/CpsF family protein